jgi:hypothetical protein
LRPQPRASQPKPGALLHQTIHFIRARPEAGSIFVSLWGASAADARAQTTARECHRTRTIHPHGFEHRCCPPQRSASPAHAARCCTLGRPAYPPRLRPRPALFPSWRAESQLE